MSSLNLVIILVSTILAKSVYAQDYKNVVISDISSPLQRAIIVEAIESSAEAQGEMLIDFEANSKIGYKWWGGVDHEELLTKLNQNKLVRFYLARPVSAKNIWLAVDYKRTSFFQQQIALEVEPFRDEIILEEGEGYKEIEKNNSPFLANLWASQGDLWLLGELPNRKDKDFFFVNISKAKKQLSIRVLALESTTFDPVLILYDEELNKLAEFNITGVKPHNFNILLVKNTTKFYIELKDKVGPVQFETGKIQPYKYAIKILL